MKKALLLAGVRQVAGGGQAVVGHVSCILARGGHWREPLHAIVASTWMLGQAEARRGASGTSGRGKPGAPSTEPWGAAKQGRLPPKEYAGPSAEVLLARIKSLDTREAVEAVLGSTSLPPQHLQVRQQGHVGPQANWTGVHACESSTMHSEADGAVQTNPQLMTRTQTLNLNPPSCSVAGAG
jgi:hypothetical protein